MIFADTGLLIALVNHQDELHARARAWVAHLRSGIVITEHVLWEAVNLCSKPKDRPKIHSLVNLIRTAEPYELIPASLELFDAGLQLHAQRPDKEWSLTDCISFLVMRDRGIHRALAYDHHFEQAGFEALLRHEPPA